MNRSEKEETIKRLCHENGCSAKIIEIHKAQYVDRQWHPHPPKTFITWWQRRDEFQKQEVNAKRAWNCQLYRDEYFESRKVGAA